MRSQTEFGNGSQCHTAVLYLSGSLGLPSVASSLDQDSPGGNAACSRPNLSGPPMTVPLQFASPVPSPANPPAACGCVPGRVSRAWRSWKTALFLRTHFPDLHQRRRPASDFLATSSDYRVYQLNGLSANDIVTAAIHAQQIGSGLNSYLRVFEQNGSGAPLQQIAANDDFEGLDSLLNFQVVSGGNLLSRCFGLWQQNYNPTAAPNLNDASIVDRCNPRALSTSGHGSGVRAGGTRSGNRLPSMSASRRPPPATRCNLQYRVENRGGVTGRPFPVQFYLSTDDRFGSSRHASRYL